VSTTPEELAAIEPTPQEAELIERVEIIVARIDTAETPADVGLIIPELMQVGDNLAAVSSVIPEFAALGTRQTGCNGIEIAVNQGAAAKHRQEGAGRQGP
jgi:hypothetical protein